MSDKTDDTTGASEDAPAKKPRSKSKVATSKAAAPKSTSSETASASPAAATDASEAEAPPVKGAKHKVAKTTSAKSVAETSETSQTETSRTDERKPEASKGKPAKSKPSKAEAPAPKASAPEAQGAEARGPGTSETPTPESKPAEPSASESKASRAKPVEPQQAAAWAPATDAGIPGDSAEEKPKVRRVAAPARGGDAPLRRKPTAAKVVPVAKSEAPAVEDDAATPEGDRIAKAIARAGIASRRDAEAMIEQGRVTLNGKILTSPAVNVTAQDTITVDGEPLPARERTRLWIYHKPRGLVTTARDPEGRQTVFEALPEDLPRVVAIGRLDINTEGLLLLTNDGGLAKVIAHPDTGWLRRYRVRAHGDTTQAELDKLRRGVTIDGMDYGPVEATLDRASGDNLWLTLGLREGKNREVKRILEHIGLAVNRLIRLSFGPFQLGDIEAGLAEEIRTKVLKEQLGPALAEQAGVDFTSPVREPIAPFGSPKQQAKQPARSASAAQRREAGATADEAPRAGRGAERGPPRGGDRPAAAKTARVPTGGNSAGPRRSVWRAEDEARPEDAPRRVKIPRRGADPRAEREAAAARGRERVGAINTGERRVLVERLKSSPQEPAAEPHRRDSAARRQNEAGDVRPARASGERPARRGADEGRPARTFGGEARAPRRDDDRPRGNFRQDGAERRGPPPGSEDRPRGPFRSQASRQGGEGAERGARPAPRGSAPRGDRSEGFRGEGFRGDKPGGNRGGFKGGARQDGERGGFKAGGKPGGFKAGGRPGGGKPANGRPANGKPGGFGRGGAGGGKPGGSGRPPGGSGRPPRGGSR